MAKHDVEILIRSACVELMEEGTPKVDSSFPFRFWAILGNVQGGGGRFASHSGARVKAKLQKNCDDER